MGNFIKRTYLRYALACRNAWIELKFGLKNAWGSAGRILDEKGVERLGGKAKK